MNVEGRHSRRLRYFVKYNMVEAKSPKSPIKMFELRCSLEPFINEMYKSDLTISDEVFEESESKYHYMVRNYKYGVMI